MLVHQLIKYPNDALHYYALGQAYKNIDNIEKAEYNWLNSISLDSTNWKVYNQLGWNVYYKNGDYDKAENLFLKGLNNYSDSPYLLHSLGEVYIKKNDYGKAIDQFNKAIEIDSTHSFSYLSLAQVYEELKDPIFIDYYQKAAEMGEKDAQKWLRNNKKLIDEHENKSKKAPATDYIEELKKLAELRDLGIITDEEFEAKKKDLLGL